MQTKQTEEAIGPRGTVPVSGTELFYESIGNGTPVIVVHGGPGLGHYYLRPAMDALADEFQLVYYDQRGTGRSELRDPDRISVAGAVQDLAALLDGLGIKRANLLGHSWGADLAALFASRHPDRVRSLIVANPGPPFDQEQMMALMTEMQRRRTAEDVEEMGRIEASAGFAQGNPEALEAHLRVAYRPFFNDRKLASQVSYGFTEITAAFYPGADRTFADLDQAAAMSGLKAITSPTLVLHADRDPIPAAFSRQVAEAIPGAQYVVLEGANHFAYMESPETFLKPLREFLNRQAG